MSRAIRLKCEPNRTFQVQEISAVSGIESSRIRKFLQLSSMPNRAKSKRNGRYAICAHAIPLIQACILLKSNHGCELSSVWATEFLTKSSNSWNSDFSKSWWKRPRVLPSIRMTSLDTDQIANFDEIKAQFQASLVETYENLRRLLRARHNVVADRNIRGGIRTMKGTRIGVYEAAEVGEIDGMKIALEYFPSLNREDIEDAMIYARAYPQGPVGQHEYPEGGTVTTYNMELVTKVIQFESS